MQNFTFISNSSSICSTLVFVYESQTITNYNIYSIATSIYKYNF